jgi:hypothetical protein
LPAWHNATELILGGLATIQAILEARYDPDGDMVHGPGGCLLVAEPWAANWRIKNKLD